MSKLFREPKGTVADFAGMVHTYDTWMTDPDESGQYTECGVYISENSYPGAWTRLNPAVHDTYLTCLGCATGLQYGRRT